MASRTNPWANRWRTFKDGYDPHEDAMLEMEARDAEGMEPHPCTNEKCSHYDQLTALYRPGVGGWWCVECGELSRF